MPLYEHPLLCHCKINALCVRSKMMYSSIKNDVKPLRNIDTQNKCNIFARYTRMWNYCVIFTNETSVHMKLLCNIYARSTCTYEAIVWYLHSKKSVYLLCDIYITQAKNCIVGLKPSVAVDETSAHLIQGKQIPLFIVKACNLISCL